MPKDEWVYVRHMLDLATLAVTKVAGKNRLEFEEDDKLHLAVTHLIQTIGEAARYVSPSFQEQY